ncbi:glycosyltransferase family 2 protein [Paenibacillus tritici]|uniref:Glycosyltransferase family 2 protein n=1 Tax=Paenibacillus tritici TaxID=1873425 RepID=A0ABX2DRP6_9BACL|nr:glycosyltransferase family 2 protein [Paenibacillus tritici]NQX47272.1 glycosyltransferase family 2 protein [Paenibacillus tritici]
MYKLSIIIPVYYNEDSLELLYSDLKEKVLTKIDAYEIVMVDDGSGDNSWEIMNKLAKLDNHIKILKLSRNFGSHAACLAGFSLCTGDCATIKAADLQEPSELILEMFESWKNGNKVVLAVRSDREESFSQKLFANTYYMLIRKLAMMSMPKGGFDCYLIDRKVIEVLKLLDEKNSALTLQVLWAGFKTDMIYYTRKKREIGKSRWTLAKKIKLIVDSLVSFSFVPIRFMSTVGALFFGFSFIWGILVFILKIFGGINVEGWTTLMIITLFSFGLIMLTFGILGEYIWRTMDAARKRPVYIIDETNEKSKTIN